MKNQKLRQELDSISDATKERMRDDYYKGIGLTLWDIAFKYDVTFACACYIVKSGNS